MLLLLLLLLLALPQLSHTHYPRSVTSCHAAVWQLVAVVYAATVDFELEIVWGR